MDIDGLHAEERQRKFRLLAGHAPFLTALSISIVSWRRAEQQRFCALRGGVMTVVEGAIVAIATREAVAGDDLTTLDRDVLARFQSDAEEERVDRVETVQLQLNAIRRMVSRLQTGANAGSSGMMPDPLPIRPPILQPDDAWKPAFAAKGGISWLRERVICPSVAAWHKSVCWVVIFVAPTLGGLFLGRWLDARLASGIFWTAPLMLLGLCIGGWTAWKWMNAR